MAIRSWFADIYYAVTTVLKGMMVTIRYMGGTYRRGTYTHLYEYPEKPAAIEPRFRGFHRYDYDDQGRIIEASTDAHEVHRRYDAAGRLVTDLRDGDGVDHFHFPHDGSLQRTRVLRFEVKRDGRWPG